MKSKKKKENFYVISKEQDDHYKWLAKIIAMQTRNELENFHVEHISDKDMPELNRAIRNSIYSVLKLMYFGQQKDKTALKLMNWLNNSIPDYWEEPKDLIQVETFEQRVEKGIEELDKKLAELKNI